MIYAAHQKFCEEFSHRKRKRRRREVVGDHLHGAPDPIVFEEDMTVLAGFGALFQGDHLGVETTWYYLLFPQCGKQPNGHGGKSG